MILWHQHIECEIIQNWLDLYLRYPREINPVICLFIKMGKSTDFISILYGIVMFYVIVELSLEHISPCMQLDRQAKAKVNHTGMIQIYL